VIHHAKVGILEYFTIAGIIYQGFINIMEIIFDINDFHIKFITNNKTCFYSISRKFNIYVHFLYFFFNFMFYSIL